MFFFLNDTATTEIFTLSLHAALPIFMPEKPHHEEEFDTTIRRRSRRERRLDASKKGGGGVLEFVVILLVSRSEEHTSELQSRQYLVCRLLLEKKIRKHAQTALPAISL